MSPQPWIHRSEVKEFLTVIFVIVLVLAGLPGGFFYVGRVYERRNPSHGLKRTVCDSYCRATGGPCPRAEEPAAEPAAEPRKITLADDGQYPEFNQYEGFPGEYMWSLIDPKLAEAIRRIDSRGCK